MIQERLESVVVDPSGYVMSKREAGGKGYNLHRLFTAGFPVPRWCVVPSWVFDAVVLSKRELISQLLEQADYRSQASLSDTSEQIGRLLDSSEILQAIKNEIVSAVKETFGEQSFVSVRSSVVGEDSAEHSFAGLMDSFLYIAPDEVIPALWKVWISAFSPRALLYRYRKQIGFNSISAAVIIQQMVDAVASGILFTRNPETREQQCVISAGYGLGEGVVGNFVETDTYILERNGSEKARTVPPKKGRLVFDRSRGVGTSLEPVPDEQQCLPVLTVEQLRRLQEWGVKAEQSFGLPQDIEWGIDGQGEPFILQSRPIVFSPPVRPAAPIRIWERSNIVESYPGLTLPLTFSYVRQGYERSFLNAARGFYPFRKLPRRAVALFGNMIGILEGRIYYSLLSWYEMLSYLPGFKQHKKAWDQMIGIGRNLEFPQTVLPVPTRIYAFISAAIKLLSVRRNAKRFSTRFRAFHSQYSVMDFSALGEDQLVRVYHLIGDDLTKIWHLTLYNDFAAMKFYDWLKMLCARLESGNHHNLHNDLLCGEQGVESVEPVRSLVRIAEMIRANRSFLKLFELENNATIWRQLQQESIYEPLRIALDDHLRLYGDRGLEELKFERSTFRDEPEMSVALVKHYSRLDLSVERMEQQERLIRQTAEETARRSVGNPFKRIVFRFILRNARRAIANRENMRFARSRTFGILRKLFRRLGELFVERGLLRSERDVFYLTIEEAFGVVHATTTTWNLQSLVDLRKKEYERFANRNPDERIETEGIPCLANLSSSEKKVGEKRELVGIGCSSGFVEGEALVVLDPKEVNDAAGKILVAKSTDPGWVFLLISSKGIVVEKGSVLSHTAIIGRELGIPTVVGATMATTLIPTGASVRLDGSKGIVTWQ